MRTAILASQNKNKIRELRAILEKYGLDVVPRDDTDIPKDDIEETGETFEDNSYLKARTIFDMIRRDDSLSQYLDCPVIADDSGLMVDALDGAPGVYSARYAGEGCTYDDNNTKLLAALEGKPEGERGAGFVTVITLIYPDGGDVPVAAVKSGDVYVLTARGESGLPKYANGKPIDYEWDELVVPDGYENTFAELGTDFKNTISHRAKAIAELERLLEQ